MLKIAGIGLTGAFIALFLKNQKPELAMLVGVATAVLIFLMTVSGLGGIIQFFKGNTLRAGIDSGILNIMIRIIGIAYVTEFAADICRDAGESSLASKIDMGGRIIMAVMIIPIISSIFDIVEGLCR